MKKILLLGANGQLGTDMRKVFSHSSHEIIPVCRKDIDIEKYKDIVDFLNRNMDFHYLINCAAYTNTEQCEDESARAFAANSFAVLELATFCQQHDKVLFHISTDYVFDGKQEKPYIETDCPNPLNVYGNSKLSGEQFIHAYHDQFFIFRVSSLFGQAGARGKGGNFVETMIRMAQEGRSLRVVNDQMMSPTHTLDAAKAIKYFIDNEVDTYGIYHCSGEGECSWYDLALEIFNQLNVKVKVSPVSYVEYKTKAKRPVYSVLDNSKINQNYQMPHWRGSLREYLSIKGYL